MIAYPLGLFSRVSMGPGAEQHKSDGLEQIVRDLGRTRGSATEVFSDFCRMSACCLANQTREEEYLERAGNYSREELDRIIKAFGVLIQDMEKEPFRDVLGPLYLEIASKASVDTRGEFYTPPSVSSMMAKMFVDVEKAVSENKPIRVYDPCVGSGGMILALGKEFAIPHNAVDLLRVTCWDISPLACDMAYVNLTLWGIPSEIVWGNTLTLSVNNSWKNIHWHRVGEDQRCAMEKAFDLIKESGDKLKKEAESLSDVSFPEKEDREKWGQSEFDF